ncbi:MAG: tRNA (guanosine(37)-N1)-methyltransferase TrmD [Dehalococcoidia bacterium]
MLRIDVLTLFPEAFSGYLEHSIIGRASEKQVVDIRLHNIRDFTHDKHSTVDDYPYGGGAGMVMKPGPIFEAVEFVKAESRADDCRIVLLTPQGKVFTQEIAGKLSEENNIILICGHYEGIDERVAQHLATDEFSIGDYLLSGGEVAAMVIIDCLVRLLPGAIGSSTSLVEESHMDGLLEYPQYTRPPEYRGWKVPDVLLSGNHKEIADWRRMQSLRRTAGRRPDLLKKASLTDKEHKMLKSVDLNNN